MYSFLADLKLLVLDGGDMGSLLTIECTLHEEGQEAVIGHGGLSGQRVVEAEAIYVIMGAVLVKVNIGIIFKGSLNILSGLVNDLGEDFGFVLENHLSKER